MPKQEEIRVVHDKMKAVMGDIDTLKKEVSVKQ